LHVRSNRRLALQAQQGRNVAFGMQYAPNVDCPVALDLEDQVWIALRGPTAEAGQIEFLGIAQQDRGSSKRRLTK